MDERVVEIEVWWDRQQRLWVVQEKDREGNQIGDAMFEAHKRDAVYIAKKRAYAMGLDTISVGTRASG